MESRRGRDTGSSYSEARRGGPRYLCSRQTYGSNPCFMQIFDGPRIKSLESYLRQGYGSTSAELWVLSCHSVCRQTWRRSKWLRAMRIKRRAMSGWSALSCARNRHSGRSAWLASLCSRLWRWWHGFICSGNAPLCGGRLGVLDATASAASFARRAVAGRRAGVDRHATGEPGNAQTTEFVFGAVWAVGAAGSDCADAGGHCAGGIEE